MRGRPIAPWTRLALAATAGALLWWSLPPAGWWPAGLAGLALLASLPTEGVAGRAGLGGIAGIVLYAGSLRWLGAFTGIGVVLLVLVQAAFMAVASAVAPSRRGRLLALPGGLVLAEALRHRWPLSGLPLSGLELGQVDGPLVAVASYVGPLGVLLGAGITGSGLMYALRARGRARLASAGSVLVLLLAMAVLHGAPGVKAFAAVDTAVVQGGGPRGVPSVVAGDPSAPFRRHRAASQDLQPGAQQLVVWPEDVVDVNGRFVGSSEHGQVAELAERLDAVVVVGIVEDADAATGPIRRFRNAAVAVGPDGAVIDRYDKHLRVPFGEYVPWRGLVDRVADLSLIPREAVPGASPAALETPVGTLGVVISFEGLFPRRARAAIRAGGEVLVIPTNSASYATADAPAQQLAAARLRAVELGRDVVLAAPTGYSAVVRADGDTVQQSRLGQPAVLRAALHRRRGLTPYARWGDGPMVLLALVLVGLGWCRERSGRAAGDPQSVQRRRGAERLADGCSPQVEPSAHEPERTTDQCDGGRSNQEPRRSRRRGLGAQFLVVECFPVGRRR